MTLEEQRKKQEEEAARAAAEAQAKTEAESQAAAQAAADSASTSAQEIAGAQTQNAAQTAGAGQSANPFGPYASADDKAQAQGMRRKIAEESKGVKYKVVKYGEYTPREGMNPEIAKRINDMNKAGKLGHGQGTGYGIVNRIEVDYSSIRDIRQAAWFGMSVPMEERDKYAEQYAAATKQDKKSVIAQFETITGDKFFDVPKSDGSKVRAGNQAMKDIGLFDISGNRLFVDKATTADFIRAAQMDPNKATGEAVYKVAKAMSKIPGSIWYGNEVTADMFKPVESADLLLEDGESYADKLADMDKAFTFSNGFTQENYNAYLDLVEEYSEEYKDNPRVLGYFLRDLRSAYSTHTGVAPVSDAKASADIESRAQYYAESAEAGEAKNDGGVSWWEAIGRFLTGMDSEPDKTPAGTKVEKKTVDEIVSIIEAEEKKEEEEQPDAKQGASRGSSTVIAAGAPDVPEVGHFMSIDDLPEPRLVASAFVSDVIPMSVYFGRDQNAAPKKDETFDPAGLGEEQLNRYKQKQGPTYQPQPKVDMVDAWTRRMQGQKLTDAEKKALGKYFNAETMGLFYGGSYGISNEQGAYGSAWITQEDAIAGRLKYGKTIGGLSTRLEASGLTGDARATAELALADFQQKVYSMAVNKDNGYDWLAAQENMYEYVISQNDDLIAEAESIDNMLRSAGAADVDAALEAQSEEENRYEAETQQVLSGTATKETLDDLARYHSQNWVDIDEDKTRQEFIESLRTYGEFFGDNGTYWQGNSAAAQEAAKIRSAQGGMQGFFDFRDALGMTAEGVIDDCTTAAMNIGVTLEQYLASAGIRSVDDILDISFDLMKAQGNAVINDPSIAESIDAANAATADGTVGDLIGQAGTRYDISTGEALELGRDIGKANRKEGFYQTAYMMVDKATYEANVDSVTRQYVEKYGFDGTAEEMYLRDLEEYMQSGALSDEMVAELKKNIQYAPSIFDIGYEIDPGWLKGKLRKTRAEAGKEVAMLNDVVKTLIPEDQELVNGISGLYQNVSGMATQLAVTGAMMLTGLGALAPFVSSATAYGFNTYAEAFDANYTYGPMKDKALAGRMAMLQTAAVTGINMAGAGSIGDVFFGSVAWDGVEAAFKAGGGKGWMALTKYLAGSSLNEAGEEVGELTVEKLFDVLDQEALAYENGEGFSVSRTFDRIFDSLDPQSTDYASLAKEFKQAFGGGLGYGMLFTLIGAGARAPGVRTGVKMYNQFDSVRMATDLFDGKTEISDESVGKVYAALAKDLQDPKFCKWIDSRSKQAINNRQMATAVLLGYGDTELEGAKKVAQLAKQYAAKSKAADEAALTGEETWMELADMVAAGDTSQIPAMDAAETEYQRSVTTSNEMKDAVAKIAGQLSENVRKWVAVVSEGADLLTSATMKERFATIMNMRQGAAGVITAMDKKVEADAEMLGEAIDKDAQDALNVMQAEEYVFGEADADMDVPYDPETGMAEVEDLIMDAADAASAAAGMDGIVDEDTLSAGKKGAKDAAGKVGGKLKSMLVQAYEALNNLGNEELYERIAEEYNAALEMAKEAGIEIGNNLKALPDLPRQRMAEARSRIEEMSAGLDQETNAPEPTSDTDPAMPRTVIDAKAQTQTGGENAPEPNTDSAPARPTADMTEYKLGVSADAKAKAEADAKAKAETEAKARADAEADKTAQDEFADTLNEVYNAATQEERDAAKAEMDAATKMAAGAKWDPKRTARIERATDIVTGTTKEQRDAAKAEAQAEANVSAMDVEAFIESEFADASEEKKAEIRADIASGGQANASANLNADAKQDVGDEVTKEFRAGVEFVTQLGNAFGFEVAFDDVVDGDKRNEGGYDRKTNTMHFSKKVTQSEALKRVALHEMTHFAEAGGKSYDALKKLVLRHEFGGDIAKMEKAIDDKIKKYGGRVDRNGAISEIVADYTSRILEGDEAFIGDLCDTSPSIGKRIYKAITNMLDKLRGIKDPEIENLRRVKRLFEKSLNKAKKANGQISFDSSAHPSSMQFSVAQLADAVGLNVKMTPGEKEAFVLVDENGNRVDEVTVDMIKDTPAGTMVQSAVEAKTIDADTGDAQLKMFAGLATLCAKYKDQELVWEIAGSQVFSAIKNNSDKQYSTTVDFGTICAKTQAIVDVMSTEMLKLGRGLERDEVLDTYRKTADVGLSVPCPVCYVFSRWMGVPSLLGRMNEYQERFDGMSAEDVTKYVDEVYAKYAEGQENPQKAIASMKTKLQNRLEKIDEKIRVARGKGENVDGLLKESKEVEAQLADVEAYNWVTQVLCKQERKDGRMVVARDKNGNVILDPAYKPVPKDILFDLRRTGEFAKYEKSWKYRTTRGAGMGKAILPYTGASLGDTVYGKQKRVADSKNAFMVIDPKKGRIAILNAQKRAKRQNLIGGQRFQSTSDYRPEWGLDYLMTFLEMQAIGSKGQLYTKVIEAVDMFATAGIEVNLSIMPKGDGWHVDENGDKVLDFSSVTGIDFDQAYEKTKQYDNVQMILVGINDDHIKLAMLDDRIGFIIPWHSSGNSKDVLSELVGAVGEKLNSGTDYTETQSDKPISNPTPEQEAAADVRTRLLTGKLKKSMTEDDLEVINGNPYLKDLYRRFYTDKGETETYGVFLSASQASQIFPYEYWDTSLRVKDADQNGKRFAEYCESLGIAPRFPQFKDEPGYWKLLIDRPMYNRDGTYHHPKVIDATNVKVGDVAKDVSVAKYGDMEKTNLAADKAIEEIRARSAAPTYSGMQLSIADDAETESETPGSYAAQFAAWRQARQAEIDAARENDGVSQFAAKTVQNAPNVSDQIKAEFNTNPLLKTYRTDSNDAQVERALGNLKKNGFEKEAERLLNADTLTTDDGVEAGLMALYAFENDDVASGLDLALRYAIDGTEKAQAMQSRKIFAKMDPTHIKLKVGGELEKKLQDHIDTHKAEAEKVKEEAAGIDAEIRNLLGGDALKRANAQGSFKVTDSKWGIPINDKQRALIDRFKLNNVTRPGMNYNRATTKQRMLEAILATPDPDANSGNGISLTERLVWMQKGKAVVTQADLDYIADRIAQYGKMADTDQAGRPGDIALARAFEAYGNITPLNTFQKMRIQRFVNMLLSPLSAMRNIIGNLSQNTVNAASDNTSGVFVDWLTSKFTGERTRVAASGEELKAGWAAWAEESVNTFKDFYVDKAEASPADQGDDKFRTGQRGRAFQGNAWEQARIMEGFLMSFGDRNFWKMAFVNSLSNQQRTAELNGTMDSFDFNKAIEQARADANYATFNEDNVVKDMLSKMRETPGVGFFVDVIMPFTGVPTNIAKRMFEYSPAGLAWSFGKHLYMTKVKGANFDQRAFVNGVSRGLSGSMLLLLGIGLKQLGMIDLGTGEEEDEKIYNLRAAQGHQYSPYIRIGDDYISLTTFAPAASAITMGAAVWDAISGSESWADSVLNAAVASMDQIFDASFMSGLSDAFGGDGSITENFATAVIKNSISQSVPYSALLGQIADSLDPYVRDTKDKSMIMGAIKSGVINKIPKAREYLLEAKTDITGSEVESKSRVGALANPLTMTDVNDDAVLEELDRLAEKTGSTSHIPSYLIKTSGKMTILAKIADSRKVNMDRSAGEHQLVLTARERSRYNKLYSQLVFGGTGGTKYKGLGGADTSFEGIREVMTSRKYQKASDEGKAKMISEILSKAKMLTQSQIVIDKGYVK